MARKQLINLHSTVVKNPTASTIEPSIAIGEIVIQAVKTAATIYTKVAENDFAEFIDKAQIQALIASDSSSLTERINTIESGLSQVSGVVTTIAPMAKSALQEVKSVGDTYVTATTSTKSGSDGEKEQTITVAADVAGELGSLAQAGQLADAYHVQEYVVTQIGNEASARAQQDTALNDSITSLTQTVDRGFSGLTIDQTHSVKSYVDGAISTAVGSVYRVKGTVPTADSLPATATTGDVYNITAPSSYGVAGTNVVWDGEQWDPLGGTFDLNNYATTTALTEESTARAQADTAINAKIGDGFSSSATVATAVAAAQTSADNKLATISAAGANNYVSAAAGSVTGESGSKTQGITVTANVAPEFSSVSDAGSLADAKQIKDYIDAAISALTGDTGSLDQRVDAIEDDIKTITGDVETLETEVSALNSNAVTAATLAGDTYVTGSTSIANNNLAITLTPDVAGALGSVSATGQLADAKLVKDYVDSAITEASSTLGQRVSNIETVLGSNATFTGDSRSVTNVLAALENNAVETITVKNTNTNKIVATKNANAYEFDFDEMVIDCGTY